MNTNAPSRRRLKSTIILAALVACASLLLYASAARIASAQDEEPGSEPPPPPVKEEPKVTVYGRALFEGTNRPVRRSPVMLVGDNGRGREREHNVLTDAEGQFRIRGVPPGRYLAFVNLAGVMSPISFFSVEELDRNASPDFFSAETLRFFDTVEVDGKTDKELTVYARRGAAISGKVTYANGDLAVNVRIHILRRREQGLMSRFLPGSTPASLLGLRTDDRGQFRIAGLPPGDYAVAVAETTDHSGGDESRSFRDDEIGGYLLQSFAGDPLLTTYYPSVTRAAEAGVIKVEAGDERADVDIIVFERELRTLAGVVRGRRDRRLVPNVKVQLLRKQGGGEGLPASARGLAYGEVGQIVVRTDAEGRWRLKDIPDGEYTLVVTPPEEYEPSPGGNMNYNGNVSLNMNFSYVQPRRKKMYAPARRELRVTADVSEMPIELSDGARVSGTISVEGATPPEYSGVMLVRVAPQTDVLAAEQTPSTSATRGVFSIEGVAPGSYIVRPNNYSGTGDRDLYVKSVTWNGRDLLNKPLEVTEGTEIEGVRIVYASNPARVRVRVLRPGDRGPARTALVFLAPPDNDWSNYMQPAQCVTGEDGTCEISAAPGDYAVIVFASEHVPRAPLDYEAEVKRRLVSAPRLTLRVAETKTLDLTLPDGN